MSKVWETMWNIQSRGFHNSCNPRARWCPWRESHKTSFPEVKRVSLLKLLWNQFLVSGSRKMKVKIHELYCCCCSVTKSCLTLCDPVDHSIPDFPVLHYFPELTQAHVHWVGDAIQPSHPLSSPSPPALNISQHQALFQWVGFSHQVGKVLELQLWEQSYQWIFRLDFF